MNNKCIKFTEFIKWLTQFRLKIINFFSLIFKNLLNNTSFCKCCYMDYPLDEFISCSYKHTICKNCFVGFTETKNIFGKL